MQWTDPWTALAEWLRDAQATEPRVHDAMQVASVDARGRPSLRTVLLKDHGPEGMVFYTNMASRKAKQILGRPQVALLLHWKSQERQVTAEGPVQAVEPQVADAYWATRDRGSQVGAWASRQSSELFAPDDLTLRVQQFEQRFAGQVIPRPPFWSGFRVRPERVEFWQGRPDRLHQRLIFERSTDGWSRRHLYP